MSERSDAEFAELERTVAELRAQLTESTNAYAERRGQQAATIDVLKAMSASPGDPQPVFALIAERALAFCDGEASALALLDGDMLHVRTHRGFPEAAVRDYEAMFPRPVDATTLFGRAILTRALPISTDRGQQQRTNGELGTSPSRGIPPANRCQYPRPNHQTSMATSALAGFFKQFRHHRLDLRDRRKESVGSGVEQLAAQREVFLLLPAGEKAVVPDALKPRRQRMQ